MKIAIQSAGNLLAVNTDVAPQIKRARTEHPALNATLAALRDDIARAVPEGREVTVDVTIDFAVTVIPTDAELAALKAMAPAAVPAGVLVIAPALESAKSL